MANLSIKNIADSYACILAWRLHPTRLYFSKESLKQIAELKKYDLSAIEKEDMILPSVTVDKTSNDKYVAHVYCTFWNDWKGLVREHVEITITGNRVTEYKEAGALILHPYDCGILF